MKKSFYLGLMLVFSCSIIFAQKSINSYKYILVPKQYEFLKSPDKYQVNSLTKFLFDKAGFTTLFTDESYPEDLAMNSCLALKAVVHDNSGLFSTKMKINLLDCHNSIIFETKEGKSKEKEYKKAYHEAIRKAFVELEELDYSYDDSLSKEKKVVANEDVATVKEKEIVPAIEIKEAITVSKSNEKEINPVIEKGIKPVKEKEIISVKEKEINPVVEKEIIAVKEKGIIPVVAIEVKKVEEMEEKPAMKIEASSIVKKQSELNKIELEKPSVITLEGTYIIDKWGTCTISKKESNFSVVGGDENFEFATIYGTSKPNVYIIKWAAYKQPQLLEIDKDGNLKVDTENGFSIYKRTN